MAAYNPSSNLLTPHTLPDTQGYGPGITAGMNNFSRLMEQGIANKRQDQRDAKLWDQTLMRDEAKYGQASSLMAQKTATAEKKDMLSKVEEAQFTDGIWEGIRTQMPDVISDEMNEKYAGSSLPGKRALAINAQAQYAAAMKSEMAKQQAEREAQAGRDYQQIPGTNYVGNGRSQALPLAKDQPPPGFQDLGNGTGVYTGPDGRPIDPGKLLQQGPLGLRPAVQKPAEPKPTRNVPIKDEKGNIKWYDPYTGQPIPALIDPNAAAFQ